MGVTAVATTIPSSIIPIQPHLHYLHYQPTNYHSHIIRRYQINILESSRWRMEDYESDGKHEGVREEEEKQSGVPT